MSRRGLYGGLMRRGTVVFVVRKSVRDVFIAFTEEFEGSVPWLYADVLGLVTIAYGNLVDPLSVALRLDLRDLGGARADAAKITADWLRVKGDPACARIGHLYARKLTSLRMTREGMISLALGKADMNDYILAKEYPDMDRWPACAQLAIHSWAWAGGPGMYFPKMKRLLNAGDFAGASEEIKLREWGMSGGMKVRNQGVIPRNTANRLLLRNAQTVCDDGLDADFLNWKTPI